MTLSTQQDARIRIDNLSVVEMRSGEPIVEAVSLEVKAGEILALVGQSGSGKSMSSLAAMRLVPDALQISCGSVHVCGRDIFALSEARMQTVRGSEIAMIFQNAMSALNPVQRVGKQIEESLRLHTALRGESLRERVLHLLIEVGIGAATEEAAHYSRLYPHQLSGGQQQRVMIAMALACDPQVLIADEATTALDVTIQQQVLDLIRQLANTRALAVLLITHDMAVVKQCADRVAVMHGGRIVEQTDVQALFQAPGTVHSQRLIDALPNLKDFRAAVDVPPLLELRDVRVHFPIRRGVLQRVVDETKAVDGVSLTIGAGETLALVGESGSGKSTLGRAILQLEPLTSGSVHFHGAAIHALSRRRRLPLRKHIQVIFQNPHASMNPRRCVAEIISEGMHALQPSLSNASVTKKVMTKKVTREKVAALLDRVALDAQFLERYPHELSGGQLQRVAIARALAVEPQLIVCDEPTSALDVSIRAEILALLMALQAQEGVSYLFITHDLSIVPGIAHRTAVMRSGKIVEQGETRMILENPTHAYTKALLKAVPRVD